MTSPNENTAVLGPEAGAGAAHELAELRAQLQQSQAALEQAEKALIQTRDQLRRVEQAARAAQSELWCIRDGRLWRTRTRLMGLKDRLRRAAPGADPPASHPAFAGVPDGGRPRGTAPGRTILVIDLFVPARDRESGALRLFSVLKMMRALDYAVLFLPNDGIRLEPYASELEAMGVTVLDNGGEIGAPEERLAPWLPWIDIAWVSRPEHYERYVATLWQNPATRVIYDTVDLHFVRLRRGWELSPDRTEADRLDWEEMRTRELRAARTADLTLVVTDVERRMLQALGIEDVGVIPNVHAVETAGFKNFEERAGLLFIGGPHAPNVDAVQWLCREVMPGVWRERPEMTVTLLGSKPAPEVLALAEERVLVPGFIPDVSPYFTGSRVFVAPLRYGAGMKGKVGQSLSHGLPCVLTPVAAEGIGLEDGRDVLIADTAEAFAAAILRLYDDAALWGRLSERSFAAVRPFGVAAVQQQLAALLASLSGAEAAHG